jgi:hypothetical protein
MGAFFAARPTGRALAGHAWKSLFAALRAMPILFLSVIPAAMVVSIAAFDFPNLASSRLTHPGMPLSDVAQHFGFLLLETLLWAILAAPVAVAMHRFILMNEVSRGPLTFKPRFTRFFLCWLVALRLLYLIVDGIPSALSQRSMIFLVTGIASIGILILSAYLAMLFPAVATEVPSESVSARIKTSIAQLNGNFWLFVRAAILTFLPVIAILLLWNLVLLRSMSAAIAGGGPLFAGPNLVVMGSLMGLYGILSVALGAALASWMYAWVRQQPDH